MNGTYLHAAPADKFHRPEVIAEGQGKRRPENKRRYSSASWRTVRGISTDSEPAQPSGESHELRKQGKAPNPVHHLQVVDRGVHYRFDKVQNASR